MQSKEITAGKTRYSQFGAKSGRPRGRPPGATPVLYRPSGKLPAGNREPLHFRPPGGPYLPVPGAIAEPRSQHDRKTLELRREATLRRMTMRGMPRRC